MEQPSRTLGELEAEYNKAFAELDAAIGEARAATSREIAARNRVNGLQKELEGRLQEMRRGSHTTTDWAGGQRSARGV